MSFICEKSFKNKREIIFQEKDDLDRRRFSAKKEKIRQTL